MSGVLAPTRRRRGANRPAAGQTRLALLETPVPAEAVPPPATQPKGGRSQHAPSYANVPWSWRLFRLDQPPNAPKGAVARNSRELPTLQATTAECKCRSAR